MQADGTRHGALTTDDAVGTMMEHHALLRLTTSLAINGAILNGLPCVHLDQIGF